MKYIFKMNGREICRTENFKFAKCIMDNVADVVDDTFNNFDLEYSLEIYDYSPITEEEAYFHADSWIIEKAMWYDINKLKQTPEEVLYHYCPKILIGYIPKLF